MASIEDETRAKSRNPWHWAILLVALGLGVAGFSHRGGKLKKGDRLREAITLITADAYDLSCASGEVVKGMSCRFKTPGKPFLPPIAPEKTLVPYMTMHGTLFFIPNLFGQAAIKARLDQEPPQGKRRDDLRRFTAYCDVVLIAPHNAKPRFAKSGPFGGASRGWVARVENCTTER